MDSSQPITAAAGTSSVFHLLFHVPLALAPPKYGFSYVSSGTPLVVNLSLGPIIKWSIYKETVPVIKGYTYKIELNCFI